ncbi:MAG: hypothetical protein WD468_07980, partial [Pirellulales bacterium]
ALVAEQAGHLAARPDVASATDANARITALYRTVFARDPSPDEAKLAADFVVAADAGTAWTQLAQALIAANEFAFID